jgi:hypothetical protein
MQVAGFTGHQYQDLLISPFNASKDHDGDASRKIVFIAISAEHHTPTHPLL